MKTLTFGLSTLILLLAAFGTWRLRAQDNVLDSSKIIISNGTAQIRAYTHEDYVRDQGRWPLTKSEAGEIVRALLDGVRAHQTALNFYTASLKAFGATATEAERERMIQNVKECEEGSQRTMAALEKWKARGAKLKD